MYDYVIVGAGSAGCVLAARLSENPDSRVLLLEAGPPDTADELHIPAAVNLLFQTAYDWNYQTVPQDRAGGRSIYWPRGRVLGGSSSINAMIYIRGSRHDYDSWRDDYGCAGWGYTDLLPYFLRAESNSRGASAYHGASGPLSVQDLKFRSGLTGDFVAAARKMRPAGQRRLQRAGAGRRRLLPGHPEGWAAVVGGRRLPAPGGWPAEPDRAHRCAGHRRRDRGRPGHRRAVPAARRGGDWLRAEAEIILSAGAIGSPQLLMLSGVGPADHLHEHNIAVMAENAGVGSNLSDHPMVPAIWSAPKTRSLWEKAGPRNLARWQLTALGADDHQHRRGRGLQPHRRGPRSRPTSSGTCCRCRTSTAAWPTRPAGRCPC